MEKRNLLRWSSLVISIIVAAISLTSFWLTYTSNDCEKTNLTGTLVETKNYVIISKNSTKKIQPSPTSSLKNKFQHAAITCDSPRCASIGRKILEKGGNVADAAVAVLFCMGVVHSQSSGLGGGFLMVIYNGSTGQSKVLNARETAPLAATVNMFGGNSKKSQKGGLSVAIPGELRGLEALFKKMGSQKIPWTDLVEPTIKICEQGYFADSHLEKSLKAEEQNILNEPSMAAIFVNPITQNVWQKGDLIRRPELAKSLKIVAQFGADAFYNSSVHPLSSWMVEDLRDHFGGILTPEDLLNYEVRWSEPIKVRIHGNLTVHTVPPPGSGALIGFILRFLSQYKFSPKSIGSTKEAVKTHHLIIQAFMHAYAKRSLLGDPSDPKVTKMVHEVVENLTNSQNYLDSINHMIDENGMNDTVEFYGAKFYNPDDHGTAHLSIVGLNGDAIAVTSTVNLLFGAGIRSPRTGIIFNDQLDDFSAPSITNAFGLPPSQNNFIRPGKRPMSSMTPTIFTDDDGTVRLVLGSAGGTKITTATAYVAIRNLWFNEPMREALDAHRIHHQLFPMMLQYENGFPEKWLQGLQAIGYKTEAKGQLATTCGIERSVNGTLFAEFDAKKPGSVDGF